MYFKSKNPIVEELTKNWRERAYRLSDFKPIKLDSIHKNCIWCLSVLSGKKHKWCSEECINSALAWAAPQSTFGLRVLLGRQQCSCAKCGVSYSTYLDQALSMASIHRGYLYPRIETKKIDILMRIFKRLIPKEIKPEIDHIIPICLGGVALGLDNCQILCRSCHKKKTKIDIRAKFAKNGNPLKGRKFTEEHVKALSKVRKGFDSPSRRTHRELMYREARKSITAVNLTTREEKQFSSFSEAARILNLQESNISRVLRGDQNRKQHKGWTFKYN